MDTSMEYTAQVESPTIKGEVKLAIHESSFHASTPVIISDVQYASINKIVYVNNRVVVQTDDGDYNFTRMGEWGERFCNALCEAYNKAVLRAMFVRSNPVCSATGDYKYTEDMKTTGGEKAPVHVYDNCVTILPANLEARRIPLCFVSGIEKKEHALTLRLDTGDNYIISKLGFDTDPIEAAVMKQKRALLEEVLKTIKQIDPSVQPAQIMQLAGLVQEGAAAQLGKLASIAPSFVVAVDQKISQTRAAEYYAAIKTICNPSQLYVGFRRMDNSDEISYWLIAPSANGKYAIVEFSETDTATFVYKTGGNIDGFAKKLNRALEAIAFKREVIRLTDDEIKSPENADYYMASKRTSALQFIRGSFAGRSIHSNPEAWKAKLTEICNGVPQSN